jgi:adenylate kinase
MKKIKNFENFEINERELPDNQGEILVILGAPGSGKGTLSKELKKDYGFVHISTGDVVRNSEDPELKKIIDGGNLVPDDMMIKILKKELNKLDPEDDIILDGFPRTIKQARKLDSMLGKMGLGLNHALYLSLPDDIAKERIRGRAKKEGRKDDASEEIIENRFKEYKEKTFPLVDFYKKSRKLVTVNAEDGKDVVLDKVIKKFDLKKKSK